MKRKETGGGWRRDGREGTERVRGQGLFASPL